MLPPPTTAQTPNAPLVNLGDLAREAVHRVAVDAVGFVSPQRLAGYLQEDALEAGRSGHRRLQG